MGKKKANVNKNMRMFDTIQKARNELDEHRQQLYANEDETLAEYVDRFLLFWVDTITKYTLTEVRLYSYMFPHWSADEFVAALNDHPRMPDKKLFVLQYTIDEVPDLDTENDTYDVVRVWPDYPVPYNGIDILYSACEVQRLKMRPYALPKFIDCTKEDARRFVELWMARIANIYRFSVRVDTRSTGNKDNLHHFMTLVDEYIKANCAKCELKVESTLAKHVDYHTKEERLISTLTFTIECARF